MYQDFDPYIFSISKFHLLPSAIVYLSKKNKLFKANTSNVNNEVQFKYLFMFAIKQLCICN